LWQKGAWQKRNKEEIFPLIIERIFQKYAIIEKIEVAVDTPGGPNARSTEEKGNRSPYRAYFFGWEGEENAKEDVRHRADNMQDQGS
jgi:hypothetical protein